MSKLIQNCIENIGEIKSTNIAILEQSLEYDNYIVLFTELVEKIKTDEDLGILMIFIRKFETLVLNMYISNEHVLIYSYKHIKSDIFHKFYNIMILSGSSISLPCYKNTNTIKFEPIHNCLNLKSDIKFLRSTSEIYEYINSDKCSLNDKKLYSVYLDIDGIIEWTQDFLPLMTNSRNSNWSKIINKPEDKITDKQIYLNSLYLRIAFKSTFYDLFKSMLNGGCRTTYLDLTKWILHYKNIKKSENIDDKENIKNTHISRQCEKMFIEFINHGYHIDLYSIDEIGSINPKFRVILLKVYNVPLFKKICSNVNDNYIPDSIKDIMLYFGINLQLNKSEKCNILSRILSLGINEVKDMIIKRNLHKITYDVNNLIELDETLSIKNINDFLDNPLEYPNEFLSYYKDQDDKLMVFLSKDFELLIYNGVNPGTDIKLPYYFIEQLEQKIRVLKHFNISLYEPETISKILLDVNKNSEVTNEKYDVIINIIRDYMSKRGVTEDDMMNKFKISKIINKFNTINIKILDIITIDKNNFGKTISSSKLDFSPRMVINLIYICLYNTMIKDIKLVDKFIES